jgi:hypothetical protein
MNQMNLKSLFDSAGQMVKMEDPYANAEKAKESSEVRSVSSTGGQKGVKPENYALIPVEPLAELARHYNEGAKKYASHQWRLGYEWSKSFNALTRHLNQFWDGEDIDPETGSKHMVAVAWHAFALIEFMNKFPGFDDRFKEEKSKVE